MAFSAELVVNNQAGHGERPVWDPVRRLFWVDLNGQRLFAFAPDTGLVEFLSFPEPTCAVTPWDDDRLLVAFAKRLALVDWPSGSIDEIVAVEAHPIRNGQSCQNGKQAAVIFQSVESAGSGPRSIAGLGADPEATRRIALAVIASVAGDFRWSPDEKTMHFIDSPTREVWAFDFDPRDSSIEHRRTVVQVPPTLGLPDGMTVDAEGMIWIAHWGTACVCRWDPRIGRNLATVSTGCPHTSSCALAGEVEPDLSITTSRLGLAAKALAQSPQSGGLFRYHPV